MKLQKKIAPPFLTDEEKTLQASLLTMIIKAGIIVIISELCILLLITSTISIVEILVANVTVLLCLIVAKFLLNQDLVREAGLLVTSVLWMVLAVLVIIEPTGLTGLSFLATIILTPLVAGFIISTQASIIITVLNWLLGAIVTWLEVNNRISTTFVLSPITEYLALMVLVSAFPLLVYLWHRSFKDAIKQMRKVEQTQYKMTAYRIQNEALEKAVQVRTDELEKSLQREQHLAKKLRLALKLETELGQLQSRIITVVSHEFRTPLSVINSSSELLSLYYDKLTNEKRVAAHERIHDSIFYLHNLLKDVTLVDQAQQAQLRPSYETISFSNLAQLLSEKLSQETNQPQRLVFTYAQQTDMPIQVDLVLFQKIVTNLLSNALKYSPATELVQVRFWLEQSQLVVKVQDQGIGIPLHEQSKVFDLFYRAGNVNEKRGLGLGLYIVQTISHMMQGSVELLSKGEGQGTTVVVRLPTLPNLD